MHAAPRPVTPTSAPRLRGIASKSSLDYQPRDTQAGVLHRVVREQLLTFLERATTADGSGLPHFVERELRRFVDCGVLAKGFARFACDDCRADRLVPFSCKGRGFCPSCGGRRMAERGAHLIDAVLPHVPVRQWVLSFPHPLRFLFAFNHELCRQALTIFTRALMSLQRRRARQAGIQDGHSGTVTVIQRFASGLRLNLHLHTLMLDGVFYETQNGELRFYPLSPPDDETIAKLVATVQKRILRLLMRRELLDDPHKASNLAPASDSSSVLAALASAALRNTRSFGDRRGAPVMRVGHDPNAPWVSSRTNLQAQIGGFDLHAAVAIRADDRAGLERLVRYLLRPAVAQERLTLQPDGNVLVELKSEWSDGTSHLSLEPLELLGRLASLIPRPRTNLIIYHGILAPNANWRSRVVQHGRARLLPATLAHDSKATPMVVAARDNLRPSAFMCCMGTRQAESAAGKADTACSQAESQAPKADRIRGQDGQPKQPLLAQSQRAQPTPTQAQQPLLAQPHQTQPLLAQPHRTQPQLAQPRLVATEAILRPTQAAAASFCERIEQDTSRASTHPLLPKEPQPAQPSSRRHRCQRRHLLWAEMMRRTFGIDVLECEHCGGRLRLLATIEAPATIAVILNHLGLPSEKPTLAPARAPPWRDDSAW